MTQVGRTDLDRILADQETRIKALERSPGSQVYIDSQILDAAADHVLFENFPQDRTILELSWCAILDSGSVGDPCYAGLLFNGDAINNEPFFDTEEYRWNVGIPNDALSPPGTFVSIADNTEMGVVSWITVSEASFGRVRFPAYAAIGPGDVGLAGQWVGDSAIGRVDDTNPGVCSGTRDDAGNMLLTALAMIAASDDTGSDRQQFAAGSWFALTAY